MLDILLNFPNFNIYSTPLLILVLQGYLFAILLLQRYSKGKLIAYLFLALILIVTCYHRTTYIIGFMGWYDTFRNTKINYWLISMSLAIGPLIYFYVKSLTTPNFKFQKKYFWHFIPIVFFVVYRISLYLYDMNQAGFDETQNGIWFSTVHERYVSPFLTIISFCHQLIYLTFAVQLYYNYRQKIKHYFSNTYKLELNWIRNFLFLYTFLFTYSLFQLVFENSIFTLSWTQRWWYQFVSSLVILYVGIKGYMTNIKELKTNTDKLEIKPKVKTAPVEKIDRSYLSEEKKKLEEFMRNNKPYLNPELNLTDLAKQVNSSTTQLSELINSCFNKNFNDFINSYRVKAVQEMLKAGKHKELSFLGIAYECGFNSKATFNRVFKKISGNSPTEYLKNQ